MAAQIEIRPVDGTLVIRAGGVVIGQTSRALRLKEGPYAPVIYVPRADVKMALLEASTRHTTCPVKGQASYFSVVTAEGRQKDAVWSYETPKESAAAIAGHLAFATDRVTVEPR